MLTFFFVSREDWSYVYYLGKLSEKLKHSRETSFAYYEKAISLNPSAVDPFYRMHASRLKLLRSCDKNDKEALKVLFPFPSFVDTHLSLNFYHIVMHCSLFLRLLQHMLLTNQQRR